jgi:glycosyltransferase involved in cell wall biosynthesis
MSKTNKNKSIKQLVPSAGTTVNAPVYKEEDNKYPHLKPEEASAIQTNISKLKLKFNTLRNKSVYPGSEAERIHKELSVLFSKLMPPKDEQKNENQSSPKKHDKSLMALVMMVKNEERRIRVSFDSVKDYTDTFVILDTGSTDSTIEICREYCKEHNITLHLKEEPFVNFCVSRNVLLDFTDEVLKKQRYLLQLDCNDELRNHTELMEFVTNYKGNATGFYLKQQWWTGNNMDSYFNIRLCKSHAKWRYKGVVHEYIIQEGLTPKELRAGKGTERLEHIVLFQDRTVDDDKSFRRFKRDKDMLFSEYLKNPNDPRTLFYLAQTCGCLGNVQDAYKFYLLRIKEDDDGFMEEIYQSYFRLGELSQYLGHPWEESVNWFLKAYSHSQRAEPLIKLGEHYLKKNHFGENKADYMMAYTFASMACKLIFPLNQILFIDRRCYFYKRYHLLGVVAYQVQQYKEGKEACIKALMAENDEVDMNNLVKYMKKDIELKQRKQLGESIGFTALTVIDSESIGQEYPADQIKQEKEIEHNKISREAILAKAKNLI